MAEDTVNLFNPHDGLTGRDGGPYLDQVERNSAEIIRAAKEKRDPDFENAPATAGTPLVDAATLVRIANPASIPSQAGTTDAMTNAVDTLAADENFPVSAFATRDKTDDEKEAARLAESTDPHDNPANPTVLSHDDPALGVDESQSVESPEKPVTETASTKKTAAKKTTAKPTAKKATAKTSSASPKK